MDYAKLKVELTDDSFARGYSSMNDEQAVADLNTVYRERNVESVTGQEIFEAVDRTDFIGLSDAQKSLLYAIVGMGTILLNGTNTKTALLTMFGVGTDTRANLAALQKESISRATELGFDRVRAGDIQRARI